MKIINQFEYIAPGSLEQAVTLFLKRDDSVFLAGGTDYIPLMKYGVKKPGLIIGINEIPYLKKIEKRDQGLFIGAMNTLASLSEDKHILENFPAISKASKFVASPQIRNVGTIGGNILQDRRCIYLNQSGDWRKSIAPCFKTGGEVCHQVLRSKTCRAIYHSDLAPVLTVMGAIVECYDKKGFYQKPLKEVVHEHVEKNGRMGKGEYFITGFMIPFLPKDACIKVVKQSVRASVDFPLFNAALLCLPKSKTGEIPVIRLVAGAIATEPVELRITEKFIREQATSLFDKKEEIIRTAIDELNKKCALIIDTGISVKSRKKAFGVIGRLIEEWLKSLE
jgi:4-hydroxybenzoyl-CoA reductase subunit beta